MPKFAANLTMLFGEVEFLDRFELAAKAGFKAVEFLFPYSYDQANIRERLNQHKLELVLHNLPAGNWAAGERGIACMPDRIQEFRFGVTECFEYSTALGCSQVNCLAGIAPTGVKAKILEDTFVDNLRFAAGLLARSGIRLLIEPINTVDVPGFYLNNTQQAIDIIRKVGSDNIKLQYDVYHMQIMEGNLASTIRRNLDTIAHLQIADNPGRNEPGTGEINFAFLFDLVDSLGYQGWIGCEYKPKSATLSGLDWLNPYKTH